MTSPSPPHHVITVRVRPSVILRELDRISHRPRSHFTYSPTEAYLSSESNKRWEDETRRIRAETQSLINKVHAYVPRPHDLIPLSKLSAYSDNYIPMRITSDDYIARLLLPIRRVANDIRNISWYPEPAKRFVGPGHLAAVRYSGSKAFPYRKSFYPSLTLREGVNLLSFYAKNRLLAHGLAVNNSEAKLLPWRPTRKFQAPALMDDPSEELKKVKADRLERFQAKDNEDAHDDMVDRVAERKKREQEAAKQAEEERILAEERAREKEAAEQEEHSRSAEQARLEEAELQADMEKKAKKKEEKRKREEEARQAEERRLEEERLAEEERRAEETRRAEKAAKRAAEEAKLREEEERRMAEEARTAEENRIAELERLAAEEESRQRELERLAELERQAEEDKEAELARQAAELAELARQESELAKQEAELAELERQERELQEKQSQAKAQEDERARLEAELEELARQEAELEALAKQEAELEDLAQQEADNEELAKQAEIDEIEQEAEEIKELARQAAELAELDAEARALAESAADGLPNEIDENDDVEIETLEGDLNDYVSESENAEAEVTDEEE